MVTLAKISAKLRNHKYDNTVHLLQNKSLTNVCLHEKVGNKIFNNNAFCINDCAALYNLKAIPLFISEILFLYPYTVHSKQNFFCTQDNFRYTYPLHVAHSKFTTSTSTRESH